MNACQFVGVLGRNWEKIVSKDGKSICKNGL